MTSAPDAGSVRRTNLDKELWPGDGITKGELITYLDAVREPLLDELRDRPLTVVRAPDGIRKDTFFQKNAPRYTPDWIDTVTLPAPSARRDVRYILCNDHATLTWLGNQACLELHIAPARVPRLERCDRLVFDLDPPPGRFDLAVAGALAVRDALDEAGLAAAAKTSGGKGLHVVVPIERRYGPGEAHRALSALAEAAVRREPELFTYEISKQQRRDRVLMDIGRNSPGATVVSAYSPRARDGAPVSFPLTWTELAGADVDPSGFDLRRVPGLLDGPGHAVWHSVLSSPQRLPATLRA